MRIFLEEGAIAPSYSRSGDAGMDFFIKEDVIIPAGARGFYIDTGVRFDLPKNFFLQVVGKSGNNRKTPIRICLGIIDSNYRGTVGLLVDNLSHESILVERGRSLAQGILIPVLRVNLETENDFIKFMGEGTERGSNGFGSSRRGIK